MGLNGHMQSQFFLRARLDVLLMVNERGYNGREELFRKILMLFWHIYLSLVYIGCVRQKICQESNCLHNASC